MVFVLWYRRICCFVTGTHSGICTIASIRYQYRYPSFTAVQTKIQHICLPNTWTTGNRVVALAPMLQIILEFSTQYRYQYQYKLHCSTNTSLTKLCYTCIYNWTCIGVKWSSLHQYRYQYHTLVLVPVHLYFSIDKALAFCFSFAQRCERCAISGDDWTARVGGRPAEGVFERLRPHCLRHVQGDPPAQTSCVH